MLTALLATLWGAVVLLALGLAPYAAPVSIGGGGELTAVRFGAVVAVPLLIGIVVSVGRRSRLSAWLIIFACLVALGAAWWLRGDRGPVGRAVWWVLGPLWIAVIASLAGPVATWTGRWRPSQSVNRKDRVALAVAGFLIFAISAAAGAKRLGSDDAVVREALRVDPGDQAAALRRSATLNETRPAEAADVLQRCAAANRTACSCVLGIVLDALNHGRAKGARELLADSPCRERPDVLGASAEAWAAGGELDQASEAADVVLARRGDDGCAALAKSLVLLARGDAPGALRWVDRAIAAGRGPRAHVVRGQILLATGDAKMAEEEFQAALAADADDIDAILGIGAVADQRGHYRVARENYVHALRLAPDNANARYDLAVLTHHAGAELEAKHDLEELVRVAPNDARIPALTKLLGE